ncbi:LacI family DNA-binding transcriptional regulator [Clostridium sp. MCC353]|uniref:LacI family DNA-binding transcriptional regulator n=1 Tax=Clostridium sp. MCC353 TaxID=2592646 RepID=UPI001C022A47|nr:LacI family DNA-binding transcriptional regulator [Clostridium sp. MCC353]
MTIYDIAEQAQVSISTVSRVLNNKGNVKEETQKRVEEAIRKNDFAPNSLARGLVVKRTKTVGVMAIDLRDVHYANTAYTIERELSRCGYSALICNTGAEPEEKIRYLKLLAEKGVDGLILIGSVFNDKAVEPILFNLLKNIPVVIANGIFNFQNVHSVVVDVAYGTELCVDYLFERGHRHIAFVEDSLNRFSSNGKLNGYRRGLEKHDVLFRENLVVSCEPTVEAGFDVVDKILKTGEKVTAVVTCIDQVAYGITHKLLEKGYRIPQDMAVTGFNNSFFSKYTSPTITTVDNHFEMMGIMTTQLLIGLLEGRDVNTDLYIKPNLVVREST